jgi:protein TonB
MAALRFPFAAGSGALVALVVFSVLWKFVDVQIDATPMAEAERIMFTRQIVDSDPIERRDEIVTRKPTPPVPAPPRVGILETDIGDPTFVRTTYKPPIVETGRTNVSGVDHDSIPLVRIPPEYPQRAITQNKEGWVKVQFSITASGLVRDAFVVEAQPQGLFDDAALKAIARWRYSPRIANGVPAERVGMQTVIRFDLEQL